MSWSEATAVFPQRQKTKSGSPTSALLGAPPPYSRTTNATPSLRGPKEGASSREGILRRMKCRSATKIGKVASKF